MHDLGDGHNDAAWRASNRRGLAGQKLFPGFRLVLSYASGFRVYRADTFRTGNAWEVVEIVMSRDSGGNLLTSQGP